MCHTPTKPARVSNICIYCGSHSAGKCTNRPNSNREEPRSTLRDFLDHRFGNTGNQDHFSEQNKVGCQQARFDERVNTQYSPNYNNYNNYQPSPQGYILGQDLSATLIDLANMQSRSLEIMVSRRPSASWLKQVRTKQMMQCLLQSKHMMEHIDDSSRIESMRSTNHAEWVGVIFRTEIMKKSTGVVHKVIMTSNKCTDDQLLFKFRPSFSDAPTMNQARKEVRNRRQKG